MNRIFKMHVWFYHSDEIKRPWVLKYLCDTVKGIMKAAIQSRWHQIPKEICRNTVAAMVKQRRCGKKYLKPHSEQWVRAWWFFWWTGTQCGWKLDERLQHPLWLTDGLLAPVLSFGDVNLLFWLLEICLDTAPLSPRLCSIIICFA